MNEPDDDQRVEANHVSLTAWALTYNLERWRELFELTANPVHVWQAWAEYRQALRVAPELDIPIPEWLAAYFDRCAEDVPSARDQGELVSAMGFPRKRGPAPSTKAPNEQRRWDIARTVGILKEKHPQREEDDIFFHVADDFHVSESSVAQAWREFRQSVMK